MTETVMLSMGPYTIKYAINSGKIISVSILSQPLLKTKKLSNECTQTCNLNKKYIQGDPHAFDDANVEVHGTVFQKKVWNATRKIPHGQTRTYADIAKSIGHPKAVRAVGTALGKNPVCIIIPCHRVIPSSGGIGRYAYGTDVKRWLLEHEARRI